MTKEVKHICIICGWIYNEEQYGKWEDLSEDFDCPECCAEKELFEEMIET